MKIEISDKIIDTIKRRLEDRPEFNSVSSYIEYVLTQVLSKMDNQQDSDDESISEEEEAQVKKRLKELGYL